MYVHCFYVNAILFIYFSHEISLYLISAEPEDPEEVYEIEVYNETQDNAYFDLLSIYGTYTKSHISRKGRSVYVSNFEDGKFSIWYNGKYWTIGQSSLKYRESEKGLARYDFN